MSQNKAKAAEGPIAVSVKELREFGCPHCGYRFGYTAVISRDSRLWQCADSDCGRSSIVLAEGITKSSIGLGKGEITYPELQDHPRRGIPAHGLLDKKPENGGEFFSSRGIGIDHTPGCFVCGGNPGMHNNIAAFVQCKAAGERVIAMFKQGARLDYREDEPCYVQVKIGACGKHISNLRYLSKLTAQGNEGIITKKMIQEALSM